MRVGDEKATEQEVGFKTAEGLGGALSSRDLRNVVAFGLLGILNNTAYVIMNAGASEIASGGVALVYICNEGPSLLVKFSLPYWGHLIGYRSRIVLAGLCMVQSNVLVAFGSSLRVQLFGVCFSAVRCGLGEASILGLSAKYNPHTSAMVTAWSSGTGFAGVFGYAWNVFFHDMIGLTFSTSIMLGNSLVVFWFLTYFVLLTPPPLAREALEPVKPGALEDGQQRASDVSAFSDCQVINMTFGERFRFMLSLWPFTVPLFIVYLSEYAMQSGAWAVIGFPLDDEGARRKFYTYANWTYQVGVFVSRSSGMYFKANTAVLWIMPLLQAGFLVFFVTDAVWLFWWDWTLLGPCFCTGLLGGAVYVNAFTLIARKFPAGPRRELALTMASLANTLGILSSNIGGLFLQACLFEIHDIPGAQASC